MDQDHHHYDGETQTDSSNTLAYALGAHNYDHEGVGNIGLKAHKKAVDTLKGKKEGARRLDPTEPTEEENPDA